MDGKVLNHFEGSLKEVNHLASTQLASLAAGCFHIKASVEGQVAKPEMGEAIIFKKI